MSKAFTREDDLPDEPVLRRRTTTLPPCAKNYITPAGERQMRDELKRLVQQRLQVANDKAKLAAVNQQILHLEQCLISAVIVQPPAQSRQNEVLFGATVIVRERGGDKTRYRIVGVDETDVDCDWVSWISPIARVLLNRKIGERVRFKFPSGEKELEIVEISYE